MAFVAGSFLLIQVLNIHPAIVITVTLVFVLVWPVRSEKSEIVEQGRKAQ